MRGRGCDENPPIGWWHWFTASWTRWTLGVATALFSALVSGGFVLWLTVRDHGRDLDALRAKQASDHGFQASQINEMLADIRRMQTERAALVLEFDRRVTLNTEQVRQLTERVQRLEQQRRADVGSRP